MPVETRPRAVLLVDNSDGSKLDDDPVLKDMLTGLASEMGVDLAEGPVLPCPTCEYYDCVCEVRKTHAPACHLRKCMEMKIGIPCDKHGLDVCPECDKCDCGGVK